MAVLESEQFTVGYVPPQRTLRSQGSSRGVIALTLIGVTSVTMATPASAATFTLRDASFGSTHISVEDGNAKSLGEQIKELKDDIGITWSQFASLFGVSRRAVHFWVEGGQMTAQNLERYEFLISRLQQLRILGPDAARTKILSPIIEGRSLYRELVEQVAQPSGFHHRETRQLGSDEKSSGLGATGIPVGSEDVDDVIL